MNNPKPALPVVYQEWAPANLVDDEWLTPVFTLKAQEAMYRRKRLYEACARRLNQIQAVQAADIVIGLMMDGELDGEDDE